MYVVSPAYLPLHRRNIVRNKILLALCNNTRQKFVDKTYPREAGAKKVKLFSQAKFSGYNNMGMDMGIL